MDKIIWSQRPSLKFVDKHTTNFRRAHDIENALRDATAVLKIGNTPTYYSSPEEYRNSLNGGAV